MHFGFGCLSSRPHSSKTIGLTPVVSKYQEVHCRGENEVLNSTVLETVRDVYLVLVRLVVTTMT